MKKAFERPYSRVMSFFTMPVMNALLSLFGQSRIFIKYLCYGIFCLFHNTLYGIEVIFKKYYLNHNLNLTFTLARSGLR